MVAYCVFHVPTFQSTPSVWRETAAPNAISPVPDVISIHSLRMEGDVCGHFNFLYSLHFNPLPPYGGRLGILWGTLAIIKHFNPLPPYGGRHLHILIINQIAVFQSTPSVWRETAKLHRKAFFISPILVQSCKKGCKRLHSAPEKMIFFEKREKNSVRNLQHLSVRL